MNDKQPTLQDAKDLVDALRHRDRMLLIPWLVANFDSTGARRPPRLHTAPRVDNRRATTSMSASPTIAASAFTSHRETVAQATPAAPRLEDVLALVDRLAPADRARLREELRVRYDAAGQPEGVVGASPPHRLRH